ncbi:MAG: ACT domain-containing protein [Anaerolineae bacterium]|nr:ACT domain-containing protein [Anaerolineae bacterium]
MSQTVEQALRQAKLVIDPRDYALLKLPARAIMAAAGVLAEISEPFCTLIVDQHEVTLIIPAEAVPDFAVRLRDHAVAQSTYRLITLDVELEPELVGFMARISAALASAGVSILPLAAYSRDHLLVPSEQVDIAHQALVKLQSS